MNKLEEYLKKRPQIKNANHFIEENTHLMVGDLILPLGGLNFMGFAEGVFSKRKEASKWN